MTGDSPLAQAAPTWSPDGHLIAFDRLPLTQPSPYVDVVAIPATGGPETAITTPVGTKIHQFPSWQRLPG